MERQAIATVFFYLLFVLYSLPALTGDRRPNDASLVIEYPEVGSGHQEAPALKLLADGDVLVNDPSMDVVQPSIASAPNGELYVAVDNRGNNSIYIYRSTDGGTTWSYFIHFADGTDSRHPSIAFAESVGITTERWVFVAYEQVSADDSRAVRVRRFDRDNPGGSRGVSTVAGSLSMGSASEHIQPRITTDNVKWTVNFDVFVTYAVFDVDTYSIFFSSSTDRGLSWGTPVDVSGGSAATSWIPRPDIATGEAGLFITFVKPGSTGSEMANQVWITKSASGGFFWFPPVQLTSSSYNQYHPVVSAAHDRNSVLVVYTIEFLTDSDLQSAFSTDGGSTWSLNKTLPFTYDNEGYADVESSHDLVGPGRFHVAYKGDIGGVNGIWYAHALTSEPGGWSSRIRVDESGTVPSIFPRPTIAVDPTKSPADEAGFAWTDSRGTNYDAYFSREWPIFVDGFESGDTTLWSSTVGGP